VFRGLSFYGRILKNIKIVQPMKKNFQSTANAFISIENNRKQYPGNIPPGFFLPGNGWLKNIVIKSFTAQQRVPGHFAQHLGFTRHFYCVIH
jgi:hypothetical protein